MEAHADELEAELERLVDQSWRLRAAAYRQARARSYLRPCLAQLGAELVGEAADRVGVVGDNAQYELCRWVLFSDLSCKALPCAVNCAQRVVLL